MYYTSHFITEGEVNGGCTSSSGCGDNLTCSNDINSMFYGTCILNSGSPPQDIDCDGGEDRIVLRPVPGTEKFTHPNWVHLCI